MSALRPIALVALLVTVLPTGAHADNDDARTHYKKGLSYFALGKYADAASEYEIAFEREPDSALLYNAAQAHRLAGNKMRALALYQSYTRLFPEEAARANVQRHIVALKAAIEADPHSRDKPPEPPVDTHPKPPVDTKQATGTTRPGTSPTGTTTVGTTGKSGGTAQPGGTQLGLKTTPPPPAKKPLPKWAWGVLAGGAVVLGVSLGVGLGVGLGGPQYPTPTAGSARVP